MIGRALFICFCLIAVASPFKVTSTRLQKLDEMLSLGDFLFSFVGSVNLFKAGILSNNASLFIFLTHDTIEKVQALKAQKLQTINAFPELCPTCVGFMINAIDILANAILSTKKTPFRKVQSQPIETQSKKTEESLEVVLICVDICQTNMNLTFVKFCVPMLVLKLSLKFFPWMSQIQSFTV